MVMRGQYLERPTVVQVGDLALEALYHRGNRSPAVLVLPPLGEGGGSPMELPIVAEMAWALHRAKRPTVRFNPRGLGASQGQLGGSEQWLEDAAAALAQLRDNAPALATAIVAIGGSAETALRIAREDGGVRAIACIAPPPELRRLLHEGPLPPTLLLFPEGRRWEGEEGRGPLLRVSEIPGTDAQFLRGLPLFGQAMNGFFDSV
jgi:alpha/beta superfamily hydrolase